MSKEDLQNDMVRVLLVDDSIVIRTLLEEMLKSAGFKVLTATDGTEAWKLLQNEPVQLLVCDTYMPQMDGLELTRLIRSQKRFSKLPIILISGTDADKDRRLGLKYGANAFISKEKEGLDLLLDKIIHILHTGVNRVSPAQLIDRIAQQLQEVDGVEAVVLGGSRARGNAGPDSDIDLGIYYSPDRALDLSALNRLATALDDQHRSDLLTYIGDWGPWINGGGWLQVSGIAVDFLYRDLKKVRRVIADCRSGKVEVDYQPGHPHAFTSAIYLAEVALCQPLTDPNGTLAQLKKRVTPYPQALQKALIERFFWEAEFSINNARKAAMRGDAVYVTGCCFRCTACLLQTLFALNGQYWMNEKGALALAAGFERAPADLISRMHAVTALLGPEPERLNTGLDILEDLTQEVNLLLAA